MDYGSWTTNQELIINMIYFNKIFSFQHTEIVVVENISPVCLLDLTADFGVKTNAKLTLIFKLREKSKTVRQLP